MVSLENVEKILDLIKSISELDNQIFEVHRQIRQKYLEEKTGKKSQVSKVPYDTRTVALIWLNSRYQQGLTAKEIFNDRFLIQKYTRKRLPQSVEAYSMCLGRLDEKWVIKVKQGKEYRYFITRKGYSKTLYLIKRVKMKEDFREKALLTSLLTKITTLKMQSFLTIIEKMPQILNIDKFELFSLQGKKIVQAAEAIRFLQASASNPDDRATLDSAIQRCAEACTGLLSVMTWMAIYIALKCACEPHSEPKH